MREHAKPEIIDGMPLSVPKELGLGGTMSVLASATAEAMREGREGNGRLPDERFHTDNIFNSISAYVPRARVLTDLRTRERTTGADALLVIVMPGGVWRYAIQAKNLMSHVQDDVSRDADPPHYAHLGHRSAGGRRQYDLLLSACANGSVLRGYAPIHLFYNELTVAFDTSHGWGCESVFPGDRSEFGVTFARTEDIKVIADARLALNIRGRARFPYDLFRSVSRPWLCLLCTPGTGCNCAGGAPWPPRGSDGPIDSGGFGPRPKFSPEPPPDAPIEPVPWTPTAGDAATEAMLGLLRADGPSAWEGARDAVRPLARAALIVDVSRTASQSATDTR